MTNSNTDLASWLAWQKKIIKEEYVKGGAANVTPRNGTSTNNK